jgi:hypothetical protein
VQRQGPRRGVQFPVKFRAGDTLYVLPLEHTFVNSLRLPHQPRVPTFDISARTLAKGAELMRALNIALAVFVACLIGSTLISAQEGHPLKDRGSGPGDRPKRTATTSSSS